MAIHVTDADVSRAREVFQKHLEALQKKALEKKAVWLQVIHDNYADFVPKDPVDIVRGLPVDVLAEVDEELGRVGAPEERERCGNNVPGHANPAAWLGGLETNSNNLYWFVRWMLRTVGKELIREELERFCARLDKYYYLVPKEPHELQRDAASSQEQKEAGVEGTLTPGGPGDAQTSTGECQR